MNHRWRTILPAELAASRQAGIDGEAIDTARRIIDDVRTRGWPAVVEWSLKLDEAGPHSHAPAELRDALDRLPQSDREMLESAAARIREFAAAQRACVHELEIKIHGGGAGHWLAPVDSVGCYAPGGRFPLPSSVLMTVIPARVAGVSSVIVASPKPTAHALAAAAIAGADRLLACGGAQAIAAMALGAGEAPACDMIVGPGNRYVTAAKQLLVGTVGIDMLAGPSEVLVIADESADARLVAADLLAQAEHDTDARAILVTTSAALIERVNMELDVQLADLPTTATAREALTQSCAVRCEGKDQCIEVASRIAPEHLEVMTRDDPSAIARRVRSFGAAFLGPFSAEVLGDYGAGPNHVLPTGGCARFSSGLSVFTFLRARTWMRIDDRAGARDLFEQAASFARIEGLEAHARAAEIREEI
jgi:phosphoribosyl-ATP pyrophosphohydrolase/phosphoribosyl-AMP cyclohydrolase/histidinol dehydrogenase